MKHAIGQRQILSCNVSCVLATLPKPLLPDQGQELVLKRRQVALDHVQDRIPVDTEIVMNQDIPHPDDIRQRDTRISSPELRREPPHRFPDDLEVVEHQRRRAISSS